MPDDIGAFLKASRCFSALGVNITRVSYNKIHFFKGFKKGIDKCALAC